MSTPDTRAGAGELLAFHPPMPAAFSGAAYNHLDARQLTFTPRATAWRAHAGVQPQPAQRAPDRRKFRNASLGSAENI